MTRKSGIDKLPRYLLQALSAAAILFAAGSSLAVNDTYDWFEDADGFAEAYGIAKNEKRPLIVYFHVDWCGYCKYLNDEFLDDYDVDDYVSNYLRVKVNPEDGDEEAGVSKKYGVRGFPTFLVTYPHANLTIRVHPFKKGGKVWTTEQFIDEIRKVIENPPG